MVRTRCPPPVFQRVGGEKQASTRDGGNKGTRKLSFLCSLQACADFCSDQAKNCCGCLFFCLTKKTSEEERRGASQGLTTPQRPRLYFFELLVAFTRHDLSSTKTLARLGGARRLSESASWMPTMHTTSPSSTNRTQKHTKFLARTEQAWRHGSANRCEKYVCPNG